MFSQGHTNKPIRLIKAPTPLALRVSVRAVVDGVYDLRGCKLYLRTSKHVRVMPETIQPVWGKLMPFSDGVIAPHYTAIAFDEIRKQHMIVQLNSYSALVVG